jgi:general secretion pathway protein J
VSGEEPVNADHSSIARRPRGAGHCRAAAAAGFTLLEMLVVLVVIGLISTMLFDGLGGMFRAAERTRETVANFAVNRMDSLLFERSTAGLVPDYPGVGGRFRGNAGGFAGLTLASLQNTPGLPTRISWRIVTGPAGRHRLIYESADMRLELLSWTGAPAGFLYLDPDARWVTRWPATGALSQMPRAIRLTARRGGVAFDIVVAITGYGEAPLHPRALRGG